MNKRITKKKRMQELNRYFQTKREVYHIDEITREENFLIIKAYKEESQ